MPMHRHECAIVAVQLPYSVCSTHGPMHKQSSVIVVSPLQLLALGSHFAWLGTMAGTKHVATQHKTKTCNTIGRATQGSAAMRLAILEYQILHNVQ
jgi:hypothetical protein